MGSFGSTVATSIASSIAQKFIGQILTSATTGVIKTYGRNAVEEIVREVLRQQPVTPSISVQVVVDSMYVVLANDSRFQVGNDNVITITESAQIDDAERKSLSRKLIE